MFDDNTMYVYGGFSQRCADYCDDIWFYDLYVGGWREVYAEGALSRLYYEVVGITNVYYSHYDVPIDPSPSQWAGPGKRWRHTCVAGKAFNESGKYISIYQSIYVCLYMFIQSLYRCDISTYGSIWWVPHMARMGY